MTYVTNEPCIGTKDNAKSSHRATAGGDRAGGVPHRREGAVGGRRGWLAALATVCFLWAGMVLGISFLEAPVKFRAPSLTLPVGLDVGRHVFGIFSLVEIFWAFLALSIALWSRPVRRLVRISLAAAAVVVAVQALWLLPILDARVEVYLAGGTPRSAPYHLAYIALEGLKLIALVLTGVGCLREALRRGWPAESRATEGW